METLKWESFKKRRTDSTLIMRNKGLKDAAHNDLGLGKSHYVSAGGGGGGGRDRERRKGRGQNWRNFGWLRFETRLCRGIGAGGWSEESIYFEDLT